MAADVLAVDDDRSLRGVDEPEDQAGQCRLARAALADQAQSRSGRDPEIDAVDGLDQTRRPPHHPAADRKVLAETRHLEHQWPLDVRSVRASALSCDVRGQRGWRAREHQLVEADAAGQARREAGVSPTPRARLAGRGQCHRSDRAHSSCAYEHRGAKRQPDGRRSGRGTMPGMAWSGSPFGVS